MAAAVPLTTKQWSVLGQEGLDSLVYTDAPVPALRDNEVLVQRRRIPFESSLKLIT